MIIERIVYCLVCLVLFGYISNKYLKSKSGLYLSLLAIQFVCIVTQLIAFITNIYVDIFMQLYVLMFNIILPSLVFAAEYLNINFEEFIEIKIGDFYVKRNQYDKAIEKYKKALSKNNNNPQTYAKLGRIYNAKGDRRTAFDRFARAIEIDRNDYRSYYEIGVIFNDMGKQADAQIVLDNSLRIKPDFIPASELLAVVLCAQNKYDEAINVYKNATRYDPDNYQLYYSMGVVRTELRDFNDAKECYEKAIELNPSLYQAYFSLGQINLLKGELDQAEKMFKKSLVSKDLTAKSYYQLAKVYILNDEDIKAVTYLGYAIDIDSSYKYKAESEPLFAKIKDYITGLSMANKVMQQAENVENLLKNERKSINKVVEINKPQYIDEEETATESPAEKLANETRRVVEEDVEVNSSEKESKFFKIMKNVLGFDMEEEDSNTTNDVSDKVADNNQNDSYDFVKEEKEEQSDVNTKSEEVHIRENETSDNVVETSEAEKLDIFEKFKQLKKAEDEKAERYRREQKIRQLEELKKQEKQNENVTKFQNNEELIDDEAPVVVRTVGINDSEEARKEIQRLEELRKVRNFEFETHNMEKESEKENDHSEENNFSEKINTIQEEVGTTLNETFENEDTMDEPHFDFMDRFKRR